MNIYFLSTNQLFKFKDVEVKQQYDTTNKKNEIVTHLQIMNQRMHQMTSEFGDRLERQHANDHGRV